MEEIILRTGETLKDVSCNKISVKGRNVTIENVTVEGDEEALYSNYNCSGLVVRNSTFISHGKNAVHIIADTLKDPIEGIRFENCVFIGYRMGVELQNHKNEKPKIDGVEFENCKFRGTDGRGYALSLTGYGRNAYILKCVFEGRVKGVEIVGFSDVTLQDCNIAGGQDSLIISNKRKVSGINARLCQLSGKVTVENASSSSIEWSEIEGKFVELRHSSDITLNRNNIRSKIHYGVMINQSSQCLVLDNNIVQSGSNYSVVRCYGRNATGNIVRGNNLSMKKPKKGKWYDQTGDTKEGFAKGNVFTDNKQQYIKKDDGHNNDYHG